MRSLPLLATAFVISLASLASASDRATVTVTVSAQFNSRTSLKVSTQLLQFDIAAPGQPATAVVDFSAGARTRSGNDVVLSVEPARGVEGPGGAADVESSLTFAGEGDATMAGHVGPAGPAGPAGPSIAGRWTGSGLRTGRLVFSLRAGASGTYTVPMRFVLSTP